MSTRLVCLLAVLSIALPAAAWASSTDAATGLPGALDGVLIAAAAFGTGWLARTRRPARAGLKVRAFAEARPVPFQTFPRSH